MTLSLTPTLRLAVATVTGLLLATCSTPPSLLEQIRISGELRVVTAPGKGTRFTFELDLPEVAKR